ncbi:hypothetical protein [Methylobacterium sp. J-092]|uniref:hypothetical protein n=1 Tax=Methylobacterium sp. J-092 TaxID=2836667 RepID=UPI001FBA7DBA|nr:hypothetical protein [Methylobacterium sp. J-092]MCJ2006257.1 hypothetical protein [Methylobacterium sp. J-092]
MKRATLTLVASVALTGAAHAGAVAGAHDGGYRAADGDFLDVASANDRIGLDGLDCMHPVVRGGRISSKTCWGNGHLGADVEGEWKVEGDVVTFRGKRYTRLPAKPPALANPAPAPTATLVDPTGRPWRHNGSIVMADPATGVIAYLEAKASLKPSVTVGTVLFRGALHPDRPVQGTAYAYKVGCPAAPYPVQGAYSGPDTLTLRGAGPVRRGCEVVGYSDRSPHAVLRFTYLLDD